ncbi:hypothetical protein SUGI_0548710 [Cryptomeria japonica]|nr:hypothetical protein SUGI_0548710 [Cryptomeria japonica]
MRKAHPPVHLKERTMEVVEIQDTAPPDEAISVVVDQLPDADIVLNQSPMGRGEDERRSTVELIGLANIQQPMVSNGENPDSIAVDQLTAPEHQREESPVSSDYKSVIQVALAFAGGSFAAMYAVPGGVNEAGRAVMGDTIGFIVFLISDMVASLAALAVAMALANVSRLSPKMDYFIRIILWVGGGSLILSFHAAAYVVVLAEHKWIVLCFGGAVAIALALLLLYCLSTLFHQVSRRSMIGNGGMYFLDGLEGGHFSRDSTRGGQVIKRRNI